MDFVSSFAALLVIWSNTLRCDGYFIPPFASSGFGNDLEWASPSAGHNVHHPIKTHCPHGFQKDFKGHCIPQVQNPCPPGQYQDRPGHCAGCPFACMNPHVVPTTHAPPVTTTTHAPPTPTTHRPPQHCPECMRKDPHTGQCVPCCGQGPQACPAGYFKGPDGHCIPLYPHIPTQGPPKPNSLSLIRHASTSCPICSVCPECISLPILVNVKGCLLNNDDPHQTHSCLLGTGISSETAGNLMTARSHSGFEELLEMS